MRAPFDTSLRAERKTGKQIEHIDVPEPWTANILSATKTATCSSSTATKNVYGLKMRVKGTR
jgi:gluconolactonase